MKDKLFYMWVWIVETVARAIHTIGDGFTVASIKLVTYTLDIKVKHTRRLVYYVDKPSYSERAKAYDFGKSLPVEEGYLSTELFDSAFGVSNNDNDNDEVVCKPELLFLYSCKTHRDFPINSGFVFERKADAEQFADQLVYDARNPIKKVSIEPTKNDELTDEDFEKNDASTDLDKAVETFAKSHKKEYNKYKTKLIREVKSKAKVRKNVAKPTKKVVKKAKKGRK